MNKTHKLKVRTARSCWKLLKRCCPTSKVKGVRYDGLSPSYQSFGSNFVKSWLRSWSSWRIEVDSGYPSCFLKTPSARFWQKVSKFDKLMESRISRHEIWWIRHIDLWPDELNILAAAKGRFLLLKSADFYDIWL